MRNAAIIGLVALAGLGGWFAPDLVGAGSAAVAASPDHVRAEIERVLDEDIAARASGDNAAMVAGMEAIEQGQAPDDFWEAYQAHIGSAQRMGRETGVGGELVVVANKKRFLRSYEVVIDLGKRYGADTGDAERSMAAMG